MQIDYIRAYALDGAPVTNAGDDVIAGTAAADSLHGGDGKDVLEGKAGDDRLYGEAGNDTLIGNGGVDYFGGGGGNDTVDYHSASSGWAIDLGAGSARQGGTTETLVSIENAAGGAGDDTLVGDPEANPLRGRAGDDVLDGGRGDDSLFGGTGADTFRFDNMSVDGGDGNDKIFGFEAASDVLSFSDLIDSDADGDADLADLLNAVSSVNDRGAGSDVVVTFDNASSVTFTGAGTGGTDSLTELVDDATTQIQVS
jgi:Ca2+-binding RTX toxin-like protein